MTEKLIIGVDPGAPGGDHSVVAKVTTDETGKVVSVEPLEEERDWFFTFGGSHEHAKRYVKLHGTQASTRALMFERFGTKWAFQYRDPDKLGIAKHGLTELPIE